MYLTFTTSTGSKTLIILDVPSLGIIPSRFLPLLILGQRKERFRLLSLGALDNGSDELLQEARHIQERWPEVMNEVDDETLDMAAIVLKNRKKCE